MPLGESAIFCRRIIQIANPTIDSLKRPDVLLLMGCAILLIKIAAFAVILLAVGHTAYRTLATYGPKIHLENAPDCPAHAVD